MIRGFVSVFRNGSAADAPTTVLYSGILVFQSRDDSQALSLSGNAMPRITGTIYAADAQLVESSTLQ
jgi:hypothetical protein